MDENLNKVIGERPEDIAPKKKPGKVGTFFFCLWVVVAVLLIQAGVSVVGIIPKAVSFLLESGGDTNVYAAKYTEYIQSSSILTILQFVAEIVCIVALSIWYYNGYVKKDKKNGVYKPFIQKFDGFKGVLFILCGCIATWGLAAILSQLVSMLLPSTESQLNEMLNLALGGNAVIGFITGALLAPICEELAMRGIILQRSKRAFGIIGCLVISAVLFGVLHANILQAIYVLPMGFFWGFVGYRYNSVIPCIFCHIINNFIGLVIPVAISPIIIFVVFGAVTAFIGAKAGYFNGAAYEMEESKNDN
jgi:membrane protease YdiL (CAAX protease family)